ncbi:MAG: hypothetical protein EOP38_04810 [Rubrivivax sp.]|nr:MAG: hypothetical protein EOP38_04810 [Rubrivivax sp.]
MKTNQAPATTLSHLTAVHMLGRILERLDHQHDAPAGHSRYQTAMQRLAYALDHVEQTLVVRQVLNTYSSPRS